MLTAPGPLQLRSSSAHCDPDLAKRIDETLGEADWRDTWRRGSARSLAKRLGETLGEEDWRGGEGEGGGGGEGVLIIKSTNLHLASGE